MWKDDLRGVFYITLKDLRAYYFKPPNISWGILFPFAFVFAFALRSKTDLQSLLPGLLGLTILFSTSSMEAIVIVFERRTGSFERLMLAPVSLPAVLFGKMLGGMAFGLTVTSVVLAVGLIVFGVAGINWFLLILALLLSAATFSTMGAFISVAVQEIFEAQTLANFIRFPMMFLGGVFIPLEAMAPGFQVVARFLPLTYGVEALRTSLEGLDPSRACMDLGVLLGFTILFFTLAARLLARRIE